MTIRAKKFTPEVLLSAPRWSAGVPDATGSRVLYTSSSYSFEEHKKTTELRCMTYETKESILLTDEEGVSEPVWLDGEDDLFVCLKSAKESCTELCVGNAVRGADWHVARHIDGPASSLKLARLPGGGYAVVLAAQANPDGSLFNPEKAPKAHSTGKLYKSLYVRHWDHYVGKEKNALWYGTLKKNDEGQYGMSTLVNALQGTKLESPVPPFGGTESFDVSPSGIIFVSKDPKAAPALSTKCNVYLMHLDSFEERHAPPAALLVPLPGWEGACSSPAFSSDGRKAAFLKMKTEGFESDKNSIVLIPDVQQVPDFSVLTEGDDERKGWDRSPQAVKFSCDGSTLYCTAEDDGRGRLFSLKPFHRPGHDFLLTRHTTDGYVSGKIFLTASTLTDSSYFYLLDPSTTSSSSGSAGLDMSTSIRGGQSLPLQRSQISEIRFPAFNPSINQTIHAWVVKPSTFDSSKRYPLAMLIHGGPQGSWADSWSTRWNPAVYAEQGYIVVAPNPTGSTSYGQAFTNDIRKQWGGAPYEDIVNCFTYIEESMPEVDTSRAVALGASYGGYMMNWINGHALGRKFKALVCHDGIFSMAGLLATEELYFPFYDLGGLPWYALKHGDAQTTTPASSSSSSSSAGARLTLQAAAARNAHAVFGTTSAEAWAANDPSRFLAHWATPQLVVHSSKDYRLCVSEGLAAFNVLQARGVDSQFLTFPDENHWVLKPENSLLWHKVVLNWINGYVGLPAYCKDEDEDGIAFYGGVRQEEQQLVEMVGMGKPET